MGKRQFFSREISPACGYCAHGTTTKDGKYVLCLRFGVRTPQDYCAKFAYAPLKRRPKRPPFRELMTPEDFLL